MEQLTSIQARLADFLREQADRGEPPPTYRDLCKRFGWRSTATARDHLRALARKGIVELAGGRSRALRLTGGFEGVSRVPVAGNIVAGTPVPTEENAGDELPVPASWIDSARHFALRVSGDSMIGAGILDGDHVIVRQQSDAGNGDIVAVTVDGQTTLKRFWKKGQQARLVAENSAYAPIPINAADTLVHGVVVGVLRSYRSAARAKAAGTGGGAC